MKLEVFLEKFKELLNDNIKNVKRKFIDPTELKERLLNRFRELFQDNQAEVERIASPKTPEDLRIALNFYPNSPAYKKMMDQLIEGLEIEAIVERLIEQFLQETYLASEKEKDEILKTMIAKEVAQVQKNMQEYALMLSAIEYKRLHSLTADKLQNRLELRAGLIERLTEKKHKLLEKIAAIEKIEEQQSQDWKKYVDLQKTACNDKIESGELMFISPEGSLIDSETSKSILEKTVDRVPANKVVKILSQSLQLATVSENKDEHELSLSLAPLSPPMPNAKIMAKQDLVNQEINFAGAIAEKTLPEGEEFSNKRVLAAVLQNNKKKKFAKIQKIAAKKMEEFNKAKSTKEQIKQTEQMFQEALTINEEKIQHLQNLQNTEIDLVKENFQQKIEAEIYKKLTNTEFVSSQEKTIASKKPKIG